MSLLEQLKAQIAQIQQDFNAASRDAHIFKTAREHNIDPEQLGRMGGDTPEQIGANAERMAFGERGGMNGGAQQGTAPVGPEDKYGTPDEILRRAAGYDT